MNNQIKAYLLKHGRVQIADFGVFEVVYKASYIHPILHTFSVPGKYVVFSENKTQDDDFAFFVAKKEKISTDEAKNRIANWVQEIEKTIKEEKKQFLVSTLGSFFINAMGRIEFASVLDTDISPQSFGLEEFKAELPVSTWEKKAEPLKTVEEVKPQSKEVIAVKEEPKTAAINVEEEIPPKQKKKRVGWWIFLILLLLCCGFVGMIYFAFPNTFDTYKSKAWELLPIQKTEITENEIDTITALPLEETETMAENTALEIAEISEQEPEQPSISGNVYVIIGSFRESANADKFVLQKQANYSNVANLGIGNSGYYLVGIGPYSEQDAEVKQKEIPNAWILKK